MKLFYIIYWSKGRLHITSGYYKERTDAEKTFTNFNSRLVLSENQMKKLIKLIIETFPDDFKELSK